MKFRIADKEYDAQEAVENVSLQTLFDLKRRSGVGIKTLVESTKKFKDHADPIDLLDDLDALNAFRILIWLARRHQGENLSLEEANDFPLSAFALIVDEVPTEDAAPDDPKALSGSVVDEKPARKRTTTSKTSKHQ